jgi:thiol-disulfide isomerase/thioredoxin
VSIRKKAVSTLVSVTLMAALTAGCASGPPVGEGAPSFKAVDLQGNTISQKTIQNKVTLLYFWATWCAPCAVSGPSIEKLQRRYAGNNGVHIVGVHYNQSTLVTPYVEEHNYTFAIIPDGSSVAKAFHISKIPSFVLLDKTGTVILNQVGFAPEDEEKFSALIEKRLKS